MRFLDTLELYLLEKNKTDNFKFKMVPLDFDEESPYSFGVENNDGDIVAKISVRRLDGSPINALSDPYSYDEVYADVHMDFDEDNPMTLPLSKWIKDTLDDMGYDENPIRLNNESIPMDNSDENDNVEEISNDNLDVYNVDDYPEDDQDISNISGDDNNEDNVYDNGYYNGETETSEEIKDNSEEETETEDSYENSEEEKKETEEEDEIDKKKEIKTDEEEDKDEDENKSKKIKKVKKIKSSEEENK